MANANNAAIEAAASDLRYVALNLRHAGEETLAATIDALAKQILSGSPFDAADVDIPAQPQTADIVAVDTGSDDHGGPPAPVIAMFPEHDDAANFEPVTVRITYGATPAGVAEVKDAVANALGEHIGVYDWVETNPEAGTATILVTEPGNLPLVAGGVPVEGTVVIDGAASEMRAAIPDEDGNVNSFSDEVAAADAILEAYTEAFGVPVAEAPTSFQVAYDCNGEALDDETIRPVLEVAATTLTRFGQLVATTITHADSASIVDYSVLETGEVSTAHLVAGTIGWGGTVNVPGVGHVTATVVT